MALARTVFASSGRREEMAGDRPELLGRPEIVELLLQDACSKDAADLRCQHVTENQESSYVVIHIAHIESGVQTIKQLIQKENHGMMMTGRVQVRVFGASSRELIYEVEELNFRGRTCT